MEGTIEDKRIILKFLVWVCCDIFVIAFLIGLAGLTMILPIKPLHFLALLIVMALSIVLTLFFNHLRTSSEHEQPV